MSLPATSSPFLLSRPSCRSSRSTFPMPAYAGLAAIFTLLSLIRSYLLRRLFEHIDERRRREEAERQERLHRAYSRGRI